MLNLDRHVLYCTMQKGHCVAPDLPPQDLQTNGKDNRSHIHIGFTFWLTYLGSLALGDLNPHWPLPTLLHPTLLWAIFSFHSASVSCLQLFLGLPLSVSLEGPSPSLASLWLSYPHFLLQISFSTGSWLTRCHRSLLLLLFSHLFLSCITKSW